MNATKALPIDAHVIALDETGHYAIEEKHQPFVAKIRGIYLLDSNQVTHCCEMTPSYYLIYLYDQVILTDKGNTLGELGKDEIYQQYEHKGGENIYVHCNSIDAIIKKAEMSEHHHYGATDVGYDKSDYDEQIEGLREHFCCNCAI